MRKISGLIAALFLFSTFSVCAEELGLPSDGATFEEQEDQALVKIEESLGKIRERLAYRKTKIKTKPWVWEDLQEFQNYFWRAMALDPAHIKDELIPDEIHPVNLNEDLKYRLAHLQEKRHVAQRFHVEQEFDDYVSFCMKLVQMREQHLFRLARVEAKKGVLEEKYKNLVNAIAVQSDEQVELVVQWDQADRQEILEGLEVVKHEMTALRSQYQDLRGPASTVLSRFKSLKGLLWFLMPLFFFTGLIGGLAWGRHSQPAVAEIEESHEDPNLHS